MRVLAGWNMRFLILFEDLYLFFFWRVLARVRGIFSGWSRGRKFKIYATENAARARKIPCFNISSITNQRATFEWDMGSNLHTPIHPHPPTLPRIVWHKQNSKKHKMAAMQSVTFHQWRVFHGLLLVKAYVFFSKQVCSHLKKILFKIYS